MCHDIHYVIVGAGKIGTILAKELGRYLSCFKQKEKIHVTIVDNGLIEEKDTSSIYTKEDIGWNKAAVLVQLLRNNFFLQSIDAFCSDFSNKDTALNILKNCGKRSYREKKITIICDCTHNAYVHETIDWLLNLKEYGDAYFENMILFTPQMGEVSVITKCLGDVLNDDSTFTKYTPEGKSDVLRLAYTILAKSMHLISYGKIPFRNVFFDQLTPTVQVKKIPKLVVCVGAGGTGGDFLKEFLPYIIGKDIQVLVIDGDVVERKNCERQPYLEDDVFQNKASVLCERLKKQYEGLENKVFCWPQYLDTVEDLENAINMVADVKQNIVLVGAVDNHRARQVMHSFFSSRADIVYIDAANEFDYGEIVIGTKENSRECTHPRAYYFPNVLSDKGKSASEMSCGAINESLPQHQATNLMAAWIIFHCLHCLFTQGLVYDGIMFFDTFQGIISLQKEGGDRNVVFREYA